jgi:hypothetical protein
VHNLRAVGYRGSLRRDIHPRREGATRSTQGVRSTAEVASSLLGANGESPGWTLRPSTRRRAALSRRTAQHSGELLVSLHDARNDATYVNLHLRPGGQVDGEVQHRAIRVHRWSRAHRRGRRALEDFVQQRHLVERDRNDLFLLKVEPVVWRFLRLTALLIAIGGVARPVPLVCFVAKPSS